MPSSAAPGSVATRCAPGPADPGSRGGSRTRFCRGNAATGTGGAHFPVEAVSRVRAAGATGPLLVRADGAFTTATSWPRLAAAGRGGARFRVTACMDTAVARALVLIPEDEWQPTPTGARSRTTG